MALAGEFDADEALESDAVEGVEDARDIHVALAEGQMDMLSARHVLDRHGADAVGEFRYGQGRVSLARDEAMTGIESKPEAFDFQVAKSSRVSISMPGSGSRQATIPCSAA